jgi:ribonucleoside-diphosphate reductase alpha chain
MMSWKLGLKANALYRDGCKLSQPLNSTSDTKADVDLESEIDEVGEAEAKEEVAVAAATLAQAVARAETQTVEVKQAEIVHRPMRRRLPDTRCSLTHKFNIAGHEGYLTVGLYDDGQPGELFITMAKEGSTIGGLMDSLGTATSVALQYGVPIQSLVNKFTHQRFEPAGMTTNRDIPIAKSLVDYIFRWMGIQFIPGYREANTPKRESEGRGSSEPAPGRIGSELGWTTSAQRPVNPTGGPIAVAKVQEQDVVQRQTETSTVGGVKSVKQTTTVTHASTLSLAMESVGDAPPCDVCGTITVRSGTCYKCVNCGNSMGCS